MVLDPRVPSRSFGRTNRLRISDDLRQFKSFGNWCSEQMKRLNENPDLWQPSLRHSTFYEKKNSENCDKHPHKHGRLRLFESQLSSSSQVGDALPVA